MEEEVPPQNEKFEMTWAFAFFLLGVVLNIADIALGIWAEKKTCEPQGSCSGISYQPYRVTIAAFCGGIFEDGVLYLYARNKNAPCREIRIFFKCVWILLSVSAFGASTTDFRKGQIHKTNVIANIVCLVASSVGLLYDGLYLTYIITKRVQLRRKLKREKDVTTEKRNKAKKILERKEKERKAMLEQQQVRLEEANFLFSELSML
ncbi:hypothetical protein WAI453_002317 [Rhynchosporium graminicola]